MEEKILKACEYILNDMGYSDYTVIKIYGTLKKDFSFVAERTNEWCKTELHCDFVGAEFRYQKEIYNYCNIAIHTLERYK